MTNVHELRKKEARSRLYQLFSRFMSFPEKDIWEASLSANRISDLDEALKELPYGSGFDGISLEADLDLQRLNMEFTSYFDSNSAPVSLHGRNYLDNMKEHQLFEELFRIYEFFGLELDKNANDFWPDSLQMELEFMHYLAYLETLNEKTRISSQKAQRDFLGRHLLPLLEGMLKGIAKQDGCTVYFSIVQLMVVVARSDIIYLDEIIGDQITVRQIQ